MTKKIELPLSIVLEGREIILNNDTEEMYNVGEIVKEKLWIPQYNPFLVKNKVGEMFIAATYASREPLISLYGMDGVIEYTYTYKTYEFLQKGNCKETFMESFLSLFKVITGEDDSEISPNINKLITVDEVKVIKNTIDIDKRTIINNGKIVSTSKLLPESIAFLVSPKENEHSLLSTITYIGTISIVKHHYQLSLFSANRSGGTMLTHVIDDDTALTDGNVEKIQQQRNDFRDKLKERFNFVTSEEDIYLEEVLF